jgi:hypothetical protein
MYKQVLASLHKLGKRDVISQQHYAVCIRNLFGGSVGPIRKQLPSGQFQNVYDGVKVRAQPLPLRVPTSPQQQVNAVVVQQQTQLVQQQQIINQPMIRDVQHVQTQSISKLDPSTAMSEENGTSILDGILPKDFGSLTKDEKSNVTFQTNNNGNAAMPNTVNNGMLANLLDGKQPTNNENRNKAMVNGITNKTGSYLSKSIALEPQTNFKKMNGGVETTTAVTTPTVALAVQNQQTLKRPSSLESVDGQIPAKKVMLDPQQLLNGVVNTNGQGDLLDIIDVSNSPIL